MPAFAVQFPTDGRNRLVTDSVSEHATHLGANLQCIAIVGTGPTGIYTFRYLLQSGQHLSVSLIEKGAQVGVGMPYSPEMASKCMLANIASIEIPPIVQTYLAWLESQPVDRLWAYGLNPDDLNERQFTPRLLLGKYFGDELLSLIEQAKAHGNDVKIYEDTEVTDVAEHEGKLSLALADGSQLGPFDRVILATGHDFPDADEATRSYFPSPWSGLIQADVPAVRVGIMGTSLSSIDAAMAVATQHGRFRHNGTDLTYQTTADGLHMTLMSWTGVLPEADFYCPLPYQPLHIMTDDAVAQCARAPQPLDAVFGLMRDEMMAADPDYADQIGLATLTADSFADAYFARRMSQDPFRWARKNLAEVEYNMAHKITVQWRYALLRMHEKIEAIVSCLDETDRQRFDDGLKKVFVDNYAAVPSESISRLLALRDADVLSVLALGEDYDLSRKSDRTVISAKGRTYVFDVFIDARGQKALSSADLPFPTLRDALVRAGHDVPLVGEDFGLLEVSGYEGRLVLAAIPYLMHERPFVQGITASAEIGEAIAAGLVYTQAPRRRKQRRI
jgi:uncharacterized NAD(P)/FAD-binding protein YdhS